MLRRHSLKGRLLLAITVLVIGSGLVISSLAAYRYSRVLYSAATTHFAENLSHQIALQAADKILINDLVSLQKLIDQHMRSHSSLSYLFVLRDGDVLAHSFADGFPANLIGANRSDPGGEGSIIRIQNETGEDFLDFAHPILEGKAGVLRMGLSEQPLRHAVRHVEPLAELVQPDQEHCPLDRVELPDRAVDQATERLIQRGSPFGHAVHELAEILGVGVAESFLACMTGCATRPRPAGELPLVEGLHRELAGQAAGPAGAVGRRAMVRRPAA